MNTNTIIEEGLSFLWRDKRDGVEYIRFRSKNRLDLDLNDISEQILLILDNGHNDFHCAVHRARVVEMIEDKNGFTYELSGTLISPLSKWEYGLVKNQQMRNAEK